MREPGLDHPQRLKCLAGTSKRIPGAGNSNDTEVRNLLRILTQIPDGLPRSEDCAGHSRPALVYAAVLAIAVVALHIAARGNGEMDARMGVARLLVETRMGPELGGDLFGRA